MPNTCRILFLAANPIDTPELRLGEEARAIDEALQKGSLRERFELQTHWAVRVEDLQELMLRWQPHIVHFSGHGSQAGQIFLQDASGQAQAVSEEALEGFFKLFKDSLQCVVLNACYSQIQAKAIAQNIPCVVGMSRAVDDNAATQFAAGFYLGVGYGKNTGFAFEMGKNRIDLQGLSDANIPQLMGNSELFFFPQPEQSLPEIQIETLSAIPLNLIERPAALARYRKQLAERRLVVVYGLRGMGTTTLALQLAREASKHEQHIFSYTFHASDQEDGKDPLMDMFWALGIFLQERLGKKEFLSLLQYAQELKPPLHSTRLLEKALEQLKGQQVTLVLNDAHWIKDHPDVREVFEQLKNDYEGHWQDLPAPLLLVGREIPDYLLSLDAQPLEGFTQPETAQFLAAQIPPLILPAEGLNQAYQATGGNPGLVQQALGELQDWQSKKQTLEAALSDIEDTCEKWVISEIYKPLQAEEKQAINAISIFAGKARLEVLEVVQELHWHDVLDGLLARGLVVQEGEDFSGVNPVNSVAYQRLLPGERNQLHQRAAQYLEKDHRFAQALKHRQAIGDCVAFAEWMLQNQAALLNEGATEAVVQALSDLEQVHGELSFELWVKLWLLQSECLERQGHYPQAVEVLEKVLQNTAERGQKALVFMRQGVLQGRVGQFEGALERFLEAFKLHAVLGQREDLAEDLLQIGWAYYRKTDLAQARKHMEYGLDVPEASSLQKARAKFHLATVDMDEGRYRQAEQGFLSARQDFEQLGDRKRMLQAMGNLGRFYGQQNQADKQRDCYQEALKIAREIGDIAQIELALNNLALLQLSLGQLEEAKLRYKELLGLGAQSQTPRWVVFGNIGLAEVGLGQGDLNAADGFVQAADGVAKGLDAAPLEQGLVLRLKGEVAFASKDWAGAKPYFLQAQALLEAVDQSEYQKAQDKLLACNAMLKKSAPPVVGAAPTSTG